MVDFCFVILHYKTDEDTIECVESINKLDESCNIIIVDNASNNGSIENVERMVGEQENIYIIKNTENLGFADGNNVGYKFAKNVLNAKYIAICNNDTIVTSHDFIAQCRFLYEAKQYFLLGPDIESLVDHCHQNPMITCESDVRRIRREIVRYNVLLLLSRIGVYDFIKPKRGTMEQIDKKQRVLEYTEGVQLHGSVVIFSPSFIHLEDIAFRSGTFLYMEEAILFVHCKKNNYKTAFTPSIKVLHKEDSSTNALFSATRQKREFVFKNMIQSLRVFIQVLEE